MRRSGYLDASPISSFKFSSMTYLGFLFMCNILWLSVLGVESVGLKSYRPGLGPHSGTYSVILHEFFPEPFSTTLHMKEQDTCWYGPADGEPRGRACSPAGLDAFIYCLWKTAHQRTHGASHRTKEQAGLKIGCGGRVQLRQYLYRADFWQCQKRGRL